MKEIQQRNSTKKFNKEIQQRNSTKKFKENFNFITNIIILVILVFGTIGYSVGFHFPNEILPGQFADGNYSFNGSVGIGTSNLSKKLTVNGDVSLNSTLFVTESGKVGIGTSSPSEILDINGNMRLRGTTTGLSELKLNNGQMYLGNMASITISTNTGALIFVEYYKSGGLSPAGLFFASYGSSTIIEIADPGNAFTTTDSGTGFAIYKGAGTGVTYIKNRNGVTKNVAVQVIHGMGN